MAVTKLENLVDTEVMTSCISAQLPQKIKFSPIASVDHSLVGVPGSTIVVPKYSYIGDADDVAEGVAIGTVVLTASTAEARIKKAAKGVEITDEAVHSGVGDPVGEAGNQLLLSIAAKVDNDCYEKLCDAKLVYDGTAKTIDYDGIVNADSKFDDESDEALAKVLYIAPEQEATIRKDPNFMDKNKYGFDVMMSGALGKIAGAEVVKSKKIVASKYVIAPEGTFTVTEDNGLEDGSHLHISTVQAGYPGTVKVGDTVNQVEEYFACPIVIVSKEDPNEDPDADDVATSSRALTIYLKKDVDVESDRDITTKTTVMTADQHYTVVLSNDSKVVLARFKKAGK